MSDSLQPHGLQHSRLSCPSPTPRACSESCPLSRWCHPTISSSVVPFSSCLQSFPASGSFPMSQFFLIPVDIAFIYFWLCWVFVAVWGLLLVVASRATLHCSVGASQHGAEKAMAPRSSTLAWKIPWTEEPGRLQSMGSLRVGHDWSDLAAAAATWWLLLWATGSRHVNFSSWQHTGSVVLAHGLSCSAACEIFLDQGLNSCSLRWQADSYTLYY